MNSKINTETQDKNFLIYYECNNCGSCYDEPDDLSKHLATTYGEWCKNPDISYMCLIDGCHKTLKTVDGLNYHQKYCHDNLRTKEFMTKSADENQTTNNGHKLTTEQFIACANKIYNSIYDYSKVNYINNNSKVTILCKEHGAFHQTPGDHLRGLVCPMCVGHIYLTAEIFIARANEKHNSKYDYSKVDYINVHTNIIINCDKHGEYIQKPSDHLSGKGCPDCLLETLHRQLEPLQCGLDECELRFKTEKQVKKHHMDEHNTKIKRYCKKCDVKCRSINGLSIHNAVNHS